MGQNYLKEKKTKKKKNCPKLFLLEKQILSTPVDHLLEHKLLNHVLNKENHIWIKKKMFPSSNYDFIWLKL